LAMFAEIQKTKLTRSKSDRKFHVNVEELARIKIDVPNYFINDNQGLVITSLYRYGYSITGLVEDEKVLPRLFKYPKKVGVFGGKSPGWNLNQRLGKIKEQMEKEPITLLKKDPKARFINWVRSYEPRNIEFEQEAFESLERIVDSMESDNQLPKKIFERIEKFYPDRGSTANSFWWGRKTQQWMLFEKEDLTSYWFAPMKKLLEYQPKILKQIEDGERLPIVPSHKVNLHLRHGRNPEPENKALKRLFSDARQVRCITNRAGRDLQKKILSFSGNLPLIASIFGYPDAISLEDMKETIPFIRKKTVKPQKLLTEEYTGIAEETQKRVFAECKLTGNDTNLPKSKLDELNSIIMGQLQLVKKTNGIVHTI